MDKYVLYKFEGRQSFEENIGTGTLVKLKNPPKDKRRTTYIMWVFDFDPSTLQRAQELMTLSHKNIFKYIDCFQVGNKLHVVQEFSYKYNLRRSLFIHKKFFTEFRVTCNALNLCHALKYIHSRNILHRDIKPENIFPDSNYNMKIGYFGLPSNFRGDSNYMAPEILNNSSQYDTRAEVYSLGCVFYHLLTLRIYDPKYDDLNSPSLIPKKGIDEYTTFDKDHGLMSRFDFTEVDYVYRDQWQVLLRKMLSKNPSERPTIDQIIERLDEMTPIRDKNASCIIC